MKVLLAWILVAVMGIATIVGHEAQEPNRRSVLAVSKDDCEKYGVNSACETARVHALTEPKTIFMFLVPLAALVVSIAVAVNMTRSSKRE